MRKREHVYMYTETPGISVESLPLSIYLSIYLCIYLSIYIHICVHAYIYTYIHIYGRVKTVTRPGGVGLLKKPKDLSTSEREEFEYGEGGDVYPTLMKSDTTQQYGRTGRRDESCGLIFAKNQRT